jgi:ABC-type nitrate/sulfonate/bicarbonate transport system ATPase subunit
MQGVEKGMRERRAAELLRRCGMAEFEQAYPHELAPGMQQRLAVTRGFLSDPAALLIDDPFAELDVHTRVKAQQELQALWEEHRRKTVIFATRDCEEAALLGDRALVLSPRPGTVIAELQIPLPRPRRSGLTLEPEFVSLERELVCHAG